MKFYRPIGLIKAVTFDLDDTLYDNSPVIYKTTLEFHTALQRYHPALRNFTLEDYQGLRNELLKNEPEIYHDVSEWRYRAVQLALMNVGLSFLEAEVGAKEIMRVFHYWRSIVNIPKETHQILSTLSKVLPLGAITNGNVDTKKLGINHYFQFVLRAGLHGRAKPWQDMYHLTSKILNIKSSYILHVGDDLTTDVIGSLSAGMQSCWINLYKKNILQFNDARLLPHIEISKLVSLTSLLC